MRMCESKVFVLHNGKKEKIMDEAVLLTQERGKLTIMGVMGERKEIEGNIVRVDAEKHEITIIPMMREPRTER